MKIVKYSSFKNIAAFFVVVGKTDKTGRMGLCIQTDLVKD